jgi:hypothetical protein
MSDVTGRVGMKCIIENEMYNNISNHVASVSSPCGYDRADHAISSPDHAISSPDHATSSPDHDHWEPGNRIFKNYFNKSYNSQMSFLCLDNKNNKLDSD